MKMAVFSGEGGVYIGFHEDENGQIFLRTNFQLYELDSKSEENIHKPYFLSEYLIVKLTSSGLKNEVWFMENEQLSFPNFDGYVSPEEIGRNHPEKLIATLKLMLTPSVLDDVKVADAVWNRYVQILSDIPCNNLEVKKIKKQLILETLRMGRMKQNAFFDKEEDVLYVRIDGALKKGIRLPKEKNIFLVPFNDNLIFKYEMTDNGEFKISRFDSQKSKDFIRKICENGRYIDSPSCQK